MGLQERLRRAESRCLQLESENMQLRRLVQRAHDAEKRLQALYRSARTLTATLDPNDVVERLLQLLKTEFDYAHSAVLLVDEQTGDLHMRGASGYLPGRGAGYVVPQGMGITGRAARLRKPVVVANVSEAPDYIPGIDGAASEVAVPILLRERLLGVLNVESRQVASFGEDDVDLLISLADHMAVALEKCLLYEEAERLAITDPSTGLFNYRYLQMRLSQEVARAERRGEPMAMAMIDLDHFKTINDTHGHLFGDYVLKEVGALLQAGLRRSDVAVRYGGEEFSIIFPSTSREEAAAALERFLKDLRGREFDDGQGNRVSGLTASAGVAAFPADATSAAGLLHAADQALYTAKNSGRAQVVSCSGDPGARGAAPQETGRMVD